ncbi:hypothetical protein FC764_10520 [Clostridium botulinum]|nr:hypothetical protein [Clostridium botulinum]
MERQIEALETAKDYINNLKDGISQIVNFIYQGEEQRACNLIVPISEGIDWLTQIINLTSDYHKNKVSSKIIDEKLSNIVEALENEDYILISDLFNYEVIPILDEIQNQIIDVI